MAQPRLLLMFAITTLVVGCSGAAQAAAIPAQPGLPTVTEAKINNLIAKMTLEEKVRMVGGNEFETFEIPRLGIPSLKMADGPLGVRIGQATAFPAGIALGATFDPQLVFDVAAAIADETRFKGRNMLLGPCVNIARTPFGGRNFESYGEDPFLSAQLAAEYVRGIQSRNVAASVKHFAVNDQEFERMTIDVRVSERALMEIHLPAFKTAVDAGSWTVMAAYNKINGRWASENEYLQNWLLKGRWNFQGLIVSDWGATHSTIDAANYGLDLEMPNGAYFNEELTEAVKRGEVAESVVDDKIRRILRTMYGIGLLGDLATPVPAPKGPASREHRALALRAAQESIVLLKNDGAILPLKKSVKRIAMIGPNADTARTGGGGSSHVQPFESFSPTEGFQARLGSSVKLQHAVGAPLPQDMEDIPTRYLRPSRGSRERGLRAEYFTNVSLSGKPALTKVDSRVIFSANEEQEPRFRLNSSVRWTGEFFAPIAGEYKMMTLSDDGVRLSVNGKRLIDNWTDHGSMTDAGLVRLEEGWHSITIEYYQRGGDGWFNLGWQAPMHANPIRHAVEIARASEIAIIFGGLGNDMETEGSDRQTMELPKGQVELINAVADANPNTIVVLTSGNPLAMGEWIGKVKAVVQAWYPGQAGGLALADVILGRVNPSAKLPVSFIKDWKDSPAYGNYPGQDGQVHYREDVFVGYRHYDIRQVAPEFPFGHGLSYTTFEFANLSLEPLSDDSTSPQVRASFDVKNTGSRAGAEVAQVYVSESKPEVERPLRELKGFKKIHLKPGETKRVSIDLDHSSFAYYNIATRKWKVTPNGKYTIYAGSSSRRLPLQGFLDLR